MVTIHCPWCDEPQLLALAEVRDAQASFTCASCGTSVALVDEPVGRPDLPAWYLDEAA